MTNLEQAKKCVKNHGVKGFRKLKLKREVYTVGKQCSRMSKFIALNLIKSIEKTGFRVQQKQTCIELAEKGHLDTITIEPV